MTREDAPMRDSVVAEGAPASPHVEVTENAPHVWTHQLSFLIADFARQLGMTCRCRRCDEYFRDVVEMEAVPCQ